MTAPTGTFEIGSPTDTLLLRTAREGIAAKVGHDLTITFESWSGRVVATGEDVASATVSVSIETGSMKILDGTGGAMPLTDHDRVEILATARRLLDADSHPTASYSSISDDGSASEARVDGTLTVRDQTATVSLTVSRTEAGWHGTGSVRQSALGIKPYRAFFGALKLADEVGIEVSVEAGAAASSGG